MEPLDAFWVLLLLVALERLGELAITAARLAAVRHRPVAGSDPWYGGMVALNVALIALPAIEAYLRGPTVGPALFWSCTAAIAASQALRYWCIATIGPRWNARAVVVPELGFVARGPYRFVRHPNYLAVTIEFLALPLAGGAWIAWIVLNLGNLVLLVHRIRVEERMLFDLPGYREAMGDKGRLVPRLFAR